MPLFESPILLISLLVSSSSILAFRFFFLFLTCLLASSHTLFILSTLLGLALYPTSFDLKNLNLLQTMVYVASIRADLDSLQLRC